MKGRAGRDRLSSALLLALSLLGLAVAAVLTGLHHETRRSEPLRLAGAPADFCAAAGAGVDCAAVLESEEGAVLGLPVSVPGAVFYALVASLVLVESRGLARAERAIPLVLAGSLAASLVSARLAWVAATRLAAYCPFCTLLHLVNLALLAAAILAVRRRALPLAGSFRGLFTETLRDVPVLLALAAFGGAVILGLARADRAQAARDLYRTGLHRILTGEIEARNASAPDRPRTGPKGAPLEAVLFFDYACPSCAVAERRWRSLADDPSRGLSVTLRHLPLDTACHPALEVQRHPGACEAAVAAAAVRVVHGDEAFWRFHDAVIAGRGPLPGRVERAVEACGLEPAALASSETEARAVVAGDVRDAIELGVDGTPYAFLNGYPVRGTIRIRTLRRLLDEMRTSGS